MAIGKPQAPSAARAIAASPNSRARAGAPSRRRESANLMARFCHDFGNATSVRWWRQLGDDRLARLGGERVAVAAQPAEVRRLDRLAQERHVALDLRLVKVRPVEVRLGVAVGGVELLRDTGAR